MTATGAKKTRGAALGVYVRGRFSLPPPECPLSSALHRPWNDQVGRKAVDPCPTYEAAGLFPAVYANVRQRACRTVPEVGIKVGTSAQEITLFNDFNGNWRRRSPSNL